MSESPKYYYKKSGAGWCQYVLKYIKCHSIKERLTPEDSDRFKPFIKHKKVSVILAWICVICCDDAIVIIDNDKTLKNDLKKAKQPMLSAIVCHHKENQISDGARNVSAGRSKKGDKNFPVDT